MNYSPNTNISEIQKDKTVIYDSSRYSNISRKSRPISNRINLKQIKNRTTREYNYKEKPKLFSLVDIKDKFHSKAPGVPNQYKRKIFAKLDYYLYNKKNKEKLLKIPQIEYDENIKSKSFMDLSHNLNTKKKKNKSQEFDDKILLKISRKQRLYKPYCWDNFDIKNIKKTQRDKLMPEGYEFYENNFMDNNKNYILNNYTKINKENINNKYIEEKNKSFDMKENKILIRRLNKLKQYKSNIFFQEKEDDSKNNTYQNSILSESRRLLYLKYQDSDIFNLRKDMNIIKKSGENSFFKETQRKKGNIYNANNETLLGWKLRKPLPSFLNYTSTKYHLLNREMMNTGKTKENIIKEVKKISEDFNPTHKQKGLTEFIDLSRVSAPNINEDYNKAIKDDPNVFKKKNNFSSEYYDIYNQYNSLCEKPFQKFNMLKAN